MMMMKNSSEAMNLRFSSVEVINISKFNENQIHDFINNKKNLDPKHLFLLIPFDAKAEIVNSEEYDYLNIKTNIDQKEYLEYFLEYIKNINSAFPNLLMQVNNSIDFEDLKISEEIKLL